MEWYRDRWLLVVVSILGILIPIKGDTPLIFLQLLLLVIFLVPLILAVIVRAMYLYYKGGNVKKSFKPLVYVFMFVFMQFATEKVVETVQKIRTDFIIEELADYHAIYQKFPKEFETSFGINYEPNEDLQSYSLRSYTTYGKSNYIKY